MDIKQIQKNNFEYREKLIARATKEEIIVRRWLEKNGVRYLFQKGFLKPFHRIVDFYIPKRKIIIEIDGGYHKDIPYKDKNKDLVWGMKKFKTIRITNERVNDGSFTGILKSSLCG